MTIQTDHTTSLDARIGAHLDGAFTAEQVADMARHFAEEGFVRLNDLVSPDVFRGLKAEVDALVDRARRIDITIPTTSNTKRSMSTVNQSAINEQSDLIPELYRSPALKAFLGRVAGEEVIDCPFDDEQYVITRQYQAGDTHGWHWGDFPFTVIWLFEVPDISAGGALQTVPHSTWNKEDPQVERWLASREPRTWTFDSGDIYFLRSDTTLHRTTPLTRDASRVILNTCWGSIADLGREMTHETMNAIFGGAEESA